MKALGFILLLIVLYFGALIAQSRAARGLCEDYPEGTPLESFDDIQGAFLLTPMGPLPDPERPGVEKTTYCAGLSMCDAACTIETKDGVVNSAIFTSL